MFKTRAMWMVAVSVFAIAVATAQSGLPTTQGRGGVYPGDKNPTTGDNAGAAVCFGDGTGVQCPARNNGLPGHGCDNSWGQGGALLAARGVARISDDTVTLSVIGLPLDTTVVYMQGGKVPFQPYTYGDGVMCLGGSVMHLAAKRPTSLMSTFPEPGDPSLSRAGNLPRLGATVYYQVLYRDEHRFAAGEHFNLSNGWVTVWAP